MSVESTPTDDPQFTRPCAIGAVIGFVTFALGCTWIGLASGYDTAGSLGLGLFTACFGGIGFGCMFGAIWAVTRPAPDGPAKGHTA